MSYVNKELLEALKAITSYVEDAGNPCSVFCASDAAFNVLYEKAMLAIERAEAEESMNSSMREALRYIAWECPSYSDAVECAKAAIGDEGKIVPTAPGAKIMIPTAADITTPANFARATEEQAQWPDNYMEDPGCPGCGTYWCPDCGDGKPESLKGET